MSRLIAFGCSHTYGHGLEDCIKENNMPGPIPSKFAWPEWLGCMNHNSEVVNMADPGGSNLEILYKILKFNFQPTDQVIILWSHINRDCVFNKVNDDINIQRLGSWVDRSIVNVDAWIATHSDFDLTFRSWLYVHHAENYLKSLGLKNTSFFVESKNMIEHKPKFLNFENINTTDIWDIIFSLYDRALDGNHAGVISHQKLAQYFYEQLNGK